MIFSLDFSISDRATAIDLFKAWYEASVFCLLTVTATRMQVSARAPATIRNVWVLIFCLNFIAANLPWGVVIVEAGSPSIFRRSSQQRGNFKMKIEGSFPAAFLMTS